MSFKVDQLITLSVQGIGSSGEGVGHIEGYTVFIDGALPGETIKARLIECHKRYGRAELISIVKASPDRVKPVCKLFDRCGGCQLMHLSYPKQLEIKRQKVVDALQRIGNFNSVVVNPCIPSPSDLHYRNKIQLPVRQGANGIELGLYARGSHDLVPVDTCYIHNELGEKNYTIIRQLISQSSLSAYNPSTGKGELRHVLIKSAVNNQQLLVILVTNGEPAQAIKNLAKEIKEKCPDVKGVVHNKQTGQNNVILGKHYTVLAGAGSIQEEICGLTFHVSPASFFQVNPKQAENLYLTALNQASLQSKETVLDAYCGVGTLSLIFAKQAGRVIGVECVPEAIQDAKNNAKLNKIDNVTFVCDHSENFISTLSEIDLILLNPPRKGCEPSFLQGIGKLLPKKLIYISCDPATLARDLKILTEFDYQVDFVQPFDMFPQTAHVETLVKLSLK